MSINRFFETMERQAGEIETGSSEEVLETSVTFTTEELAQAVNNSYDNLEGPSDEATSIKNFINAQKGKIKLTVNTPVGNLGLNLYPTLFDDSIYDSRNFEGSDLIEVDLSSIGGSKTLNQIIVRGVSWINQDYIRFSITIIPIQNGEVSQEEFEKLVKQTPTDIAFDTDGNLVLKHDSDIITKQTPLSLGAMKGPIETIEINAPAEATEGTITANQLAILQKSDLNEVMFNHERFIDMDLGHTEGFLTYTHVGIENNIVYVKTFTITINTLAWKINIRPVPNLEYDEDSKTLSIMY